MEECVGGSDSRFLAAAGSRGWSRRSDVAPPELCQLTNTGSIKMSLLRSLFV
jgi:hypothetical protein